MMDGCLNFYIDAQPQKGHIVSKGLHKNTMNLFAKIFKIDRIIKTIGMTIKTKIFNYSYS